jgi:hypothetical protein
VRNARRRLRPEPMTRLHRGRFRNLPEPTTEVSGVSVRKQRKSGQSSFTAQAISVGKRPGDRRESLAALVSPELLVALDARPAR